jgi:hypothetical protein
LIFEGEGAKDIHPQLANLPQRAHRYICLALIAHKDPHRFACSYDQQGLFEARIKTREEVKIREMFPVAVNEANVKPFAVHSQP